MIKNNTTNMNYTMDRFKQHNFDDIRPVYDSEVPIYIEKLLTDTNFRSAVEPMIKPLTWDMFSHSMLSCKTVLNFQRNIIYPFVKQIIAKTTMGLSGNGFEHLSNDKSYLFISNHRDIVLDAALLNILFFDNDLNTSEIAIGDNLLIYPWITDLVRLNKSFMVKRKVSVREMLATSKQLSEYIYDTINRRGQSIWLAQREGRAKDSNDKTQGSLLKMLTLYDRAKTAESLQALNIVPLSITYEYDPCDYLKAKEFQQKRDNPEYVKSQADDIENMTTGIMGNKGRVVFSFGSPIKDALIKIAEESDRAAEILSKTGEAIDKEIYKNYQFFPINWVAYDMMMSVSNNSDKYNEEDVSSFSNYIDAQIEKIDLPNKDYDFLRDRIIEMYGNTVKNHLSVV